MIVEALVIQLACIIYEWILVQRLEKARVIGILAMVGLPGPILRQLATKEVKVGRPVMERDFIAYPTCYGRATVHTPIHALPAVTCHCTHAPRACRSLTTAMMRMMTWIAMLRMSSRTRRQPPARD